MRTRIIAIVFGLLFAGVALTAPAAAQDVDPTTTTLLPGATAIGDGFAFTGAVITTPADPTPRTMDGYHAAVFVQSWFPEAMFGKPTIQDPPADLPVYRVDITGTWGTPPSVQTVYYASDGTTAWLSYPQNQPVTLTPPDPPPPSGWFVAPQRTLDAFNGTATLGQTAGVIEANTPATAPQPGEAVTGSSSSSSIVWWVLLGGAIVVVVFALVVLRRRRASRITAA